MIFFSELYVGFYLNPPQPSFFKGGGFSLLEIILVTRSSPLFFKDEQQRCARGGDFYESIQ